MASRRRTIMPIQMKTPTRVQDSAKPFESVFAPAAAVDRVLLHGSYVGVKDTCVQGLGKCGSKLARRATRPRREANTDTVFLIFPVSL